MAMSERNPGLFGGNQFKLGVFGANCSGGLSLLKERWHGRWEDNVTVAKLADEAGIECLVPLQRWKGYGGASDVNSNCLDSIAWACGLLGQTRHISIFATVHATLLHPVFAAKQMTTADLIGSGRFGINLVPGSDAAEFRMFGQEIEEHTDRYAMAQEWWDVIRRAWSGGKEFDFDGRYFKLHGVISRPTPFGGAIPPMMNAGASPIGRDFAIRNWDMHYDWCQTPEDSRERIKDSKARALPRTLQVWSPISVVCRPTTSEVQNVLDDCIADADWEAIDRRNSSRLAPRGSKSQSPKSVAAIPPAGAGTRCDRARSLFNFRNARSRRRRAQSTERSRLRWRLHYLHRLCARVTIFHPGGTPRLEHRGLRAPCRWCALRASM